ncbi:MAG: citrate (Si)-synthase, partial [Alphaproteobacteria bacterium]|nr:citrate (Si)-synthase [Alphaproteobacteria bacterium]
MAAKIISLGGADGGTDFDVMSGTLGPDVIDIRKLYGATDQFTY